MIICKDTLYDGRTVVTECANWEEACDLFEVSRRSYAIYICTIRDTRTARYRRIKFSDKFQSNGLQFEGAASTFKSQTEHGVPH